MSNGSIRLFISHASDDSVLVERLIAFLRPALNLPGSAIRCTSVDGYRLPGGANTNEQLRSEVHEAETFVGVVSNRSLHSLYVLFELGARWGASKHLLPVLAPGTSADLLGGPLAGINALRLDNRAQLHQIVSDLGSELGLQVENPSSYERYIQELLDLPPDIPSQNAPGGGADTDHQRGRIAKLEEKMPELFNEMRNDLMAHPFVREFVLLERGWIYNSDPNKVIFCYFFDDHDNLRGKLQVLENYGLVREITFNNVVRFIIEESLADYLGQSEDVASV